MMTRFYFFEAMDSYHHIIYGTLDSSLSADLVAGDFSFLAQTLKNRLSGG